MTGHKHILALIATGLVGLLPLSHASAQDSGSNNSVSDLADRPLYLAGGRGVPGNLVLTPSVEYPTIQSFANLGDYTTDKAFVGYFDSGKCYVYKYSETESERHFEPSSLTADRTCGGINEWSGNFLNWATTQTIDPFRKALTGGYRVKDSSEETWLEKARHPGQSDLNSRSISGAEVARATPFSDSKIEIIIDGMGKSMRFELGSNGSDNVGIQDYDPSNFPYRDYDGDDANYPYKVAMRVKVCDDSLGTSMLEDNCVQYDNAWKPEGLIQKNVDTLRYSVFGYLNDSNSYRDGAVLRADQRDVSSEWDEDTGEIYPNPDGAPEGNSGVINYINKFGQLNDYDHKSNDPVSELYYAATRYLKNQGNIPDYTDDASTKDKDGFPVITEWDDPLQYECQATAILGIGDANTHDDSNLPGAVYNAPEEPLTPSEVNSDKSVDVTNVTNLVGAMEPGLTNTLGEHEFTGRGNTAYIAGLAYDNHINDMRPGGLSREAGKQVASTHWVDVMENERLECATSNQYYLAAKYGGFRVPDDYDPTRTEALPEDWWTTGDTLSCGDNGSGEMTRPENFYTADDAARMVESLTRAFDNIVSDAIGSSTSVTFNTATIESDTLLFGAEFNSADWTGNLFATSIERSPSGPPTIADDYSWEAGEELDKRVEEEGDTRNIYTFNDAGGIEFTTANLNSFTQRMQDDLGFGGDSDLAEDRVEYLRGQDKAGFRVRDSLLGDIVNSTPVYIQGASLSWPESSAFGTEEDGYSTFATEVSDRDGVIYVGANDGMLHAFDGGSGEELFAYIPEFLASAEEDDGLHYLTDPAYSHRYYVDLTPVISEVNTRGAGGSEKDWRSILIGGARTGGKGIFALDVTDPDDFDNGADSIPLWEFTAEDDLRLGYITEPPTISLVDWGNGDYKWTVLLPNGYMSETASTGLFMLDIEAGLDGWQDGDYEYIEFDNANDASGLSPLKQVDLEGSDRIVDRIYAGDLKGNLWVAADQGNGWGVVYDDALFTATNGANAQPITAAPLAIRYPDQEEADPTDSPGKGGGKKDSPTSPQVMVLFGTGKYLELTDVNNTDTQSFYGVFDQVGNLSRADLVSRTLENGEVTADDNVTYDVRKTAENDVEFDPTTHDGWYVDLIDAGERINLSAQVRGDYVFVNSLVPTTNPCDIGGDGWLMAFGLDGRTPDRTIWPKIGEPVVGFKVTGGIPNQTSFIDDYALTPLSNSDILPDEVNTGSTSGALGRRSWQELYD